MTEAQVEGTAILEAVPVEGVVPKADVLEGAATGPEVRIVMRTSSSTITRWQRRTINGPCGPVVVGRQPCEPHYPTLLSLGGGSHLKGESHPSPNRLVFWGDWAFP
jgi:hypothetical protein